MDNVDANNVILRLFAMVPFPAKLADSHSGESFPLIRALGSLFDQVGADRSIMRESSNLLVPWTTGWTLKFAKARLSVLPSDYYCEPAPPKNASNAGGAGGDNKEDDRDSDTDDEDEEGWEADMEADAEEVPMDSHLLSWLLQEEEDDLEQATLSQGMPALGSDAMSSLADGLA
jgi:hypothetical protein